MRRTVALLLTALVVAVTLSCSGRSLGIKRVGDEVFGTGTVQRFTTEGGFYAIRGDDGVVYEPMILPQEFNVDGLRVRFNATIRDDVVSFHMVGPIIELAKINRY